MICPKCHFEWEEGEHISEDERRRQLESENELKKIHKEHPESIGMPTGDGGIC